MNRIICLLVCLLSIGLPLNEARADVEKCLPDVQKFCAGIQPGEGRIEACLQANERKLSAVCRRTIREVHEGIQNYFADCREDARNLCRGMRGGAKIQECLRKNKRKLSRKCSKSLRKAPTFEN